MTATYSLLSLVSSGLRIYQASTVIGGLRQLNHLFR